MTSADQVERELKLGAWPEFVLPELNGIDGGLEVGVPERHELDALYYDTPELHLLRRGVTLRFRRGEPPGDVWTAKLPSDAAAAGLARREITIAGRRESLPAKLEDLTRGWAFGHRLRPVARMHTLRVSLPLCDAAGTVVAMLADDSVTVRRGRRAAARFRELEVELVGDAPPEVLTAVDDRLRTAGAQKVTQIPKLSRALGREATQPWPLEAPTLPPKASLSAAAHAQLVRHLARLVDAHAPVVLGVPGSAAAARGAGRSLRTGLEVFAPLLDPQPQPAVSDSLAWLDEQLAPVVELDALAGRLRAAPISNAEREAVDARVRAAHRRAHGRVLRALRERRYAELLDQLLRTAGAAPAQSGPGSRRASAAGAKFVRASWRPLRDGTAPGEAALDRLAASLELVVGHTADGAGASAAVRRLRAANASRAEAGSLHRRLRALGRRGDTAAAWSAGVLAGIELARADTAAAELDRLWSEASRKANWSWTD